MTELYTDHLETQTGLRHERFDHLEGRDLRPEYVEHRIVPSESRDVAYLVSRVECLTKPFNVADVSSDGTEIVICSCSDFFYRCSAGLEVDMNPEDITSCKHSTVYKELRAARDESQTEL